MTDKEQQARGHAAVYGEPVVPTFDPAHPERGGIVAGETFDRVLTDTERAAVFERIAGQAGMRAAHIESHTTIDLQRARDEITAWSDAVVLGPHVLLMAPRAYALLRWEALVPDRDGEYRYTPLDDRGLRRTSDPVWRTVARERMRTWAVR